MTAELELRTSGAVEVGSDRVVLTLTALRLRDPEVSLSMEELAEVGRRLGAARDALPWWLGDWFVMAEKTYGSTYAAAEKITDLSYKTLAQLAWVCRSVQSSRRRENLSFAHHAEVASLEPWQQERWLAHAVEHRLSQKQLRAAIRGDDHVRASGADVALLRWSYPRDRVARWETEAEQAGLELAEWAANVLDQAVRVAA